mmetsp:Transcript_15721/g.24145  ORF Transcript_15721/g.24145 Transcript_15721/m.24145 type:complete len:80 (-) Transcript_15721:1011-1250(-)
MDGRRTLNRARHTSLRTAEDPSELALLLLSLDGNLLADFFLDLIKGFKEELFDFGPLIKHHLRESSNVLEFLVLALEVL